MSYEIAQAMGTNVTYGWLVVTAPNVTGLKGGTSQVVIAGGIVTIGGDIIIAINGVRITNIDALSTYLEENTLPSQIVNVTVVRNNQTITLLITLGTRPVPSA
jgi:S1-C subfamily serine protease